MARRPEIRTLEIHSHQYLLSRTWVYLQVTVICERCKNRTETRTIQFALCTFSEGEEAEVLSKNVFAIGGGLALASVQMLGYQRQEDIVQAA